MAQGAHAMSWTGVILAGGRSSRMGRDKALLPWKGGTFLSRAENLLRGLVGDVIVSGGHGIRDLVPGLGPVGGLRTILAFRPEAEKILLLPVDMPHLSLDVLSVLRDSAERTDVRAVHFENHEMPAAFRADHSMREAVEQLCDPSVPAAGRSVRALLGAMGARAIPLPSPEPFRNINRPEDLP